jgi:hypothetical protein
MNSCVIFLIFWCVISVNPLHSKKHTMSHGHVFHPPTWVYQIFELFDQNQVCTSKIVKWLWVCLKIGETSKWPSAIIIEKMAMNMRFNLDLGVPDF